MDSLVQRQGRELAAAQAKARGLNASGASLKGGRAASGVPGPSAAAVHAEKAPGKQKKTQGSAAAGIAPPKATRGPTLPAPPPEATGVAASNGQEEPAESPDCKTLKDPTKQKSQTIKLPSLAFTSASSKQTLAQHQSEPGQAEHKLLEEVVRQSASESTTTSRNSTTGSTTTTSSGENAESMADESFEGSPKAFSRVAFTEAISLPAVSRAAARPSFEASAQVEANSFEKDDRSGTDLSWSFGARRLAARLFGFKCISNLIPFARAAQSCDETAGASTRGEGTRSGRLIRKGGGSSPFEPPQAPAMPTALVAPKKKRPKDSSSPSQRQRHPMHRLNPLRYVPTTLLDAARSTAKIPAYLTKGSRSKWGRLLWVVAILLVCILGAIGVGLVLENKFPDLYTFSKYPGHGRGPPRRPAEPGR
eukprot:GHVT01062162.1.p1 GENE.GHVT01062162.1~~GHVT01062162.1.p1  ORF type:complete len:421 (-),score=74.18 GHVT01062162.1:4962-6224(-)